MIIRLKVLDIVSLCAIYIRGDTSVVTTLANQQSGGNNGASYIEFIMFNIKGVISLQHQHKFHCAATTEDGVSEGFYNMSEIHTHVK